MTVSSSALKEAAGADDDDVLLVFSTASSTSDRNDIFLKRGVLVRRLPDRAVPDEWRV